MIHGHNASPRKAEERKLEEASGKSRWGSRKREEQMDKTSKYEDSGRSKKLEQAPGRQNRGRPEKRDQKWASLKEQTSRDC
jgi:hypothetical protein